MGLSVGVPKNEMISSKTQLCPDIESDQPTSFLLDDV